MQAPIDSIRKLAAYGIPLGCTNAEFNRARDEVAAWLDSGPQQMERVPDGWKDATKELPPIAPDRSRSEWVEVRAKGFYYEWGPEQEWTVRSQDVTHWRPIAGEGEEGGSDE